MKVYIKILIKTIILTSLFLVLYYLFIIIPNIERQRELIKARDMLTTNINILTQNRISYFELTRLDPDSTDFDYIRPNLVATIQKTNKEGLDHPDFPDEAKIIFQRQNDLMEKVFATKSYEEGLDILRSEEALKLLTNQTNLILRLQKEIQEFEKGLK